MGQSFMRVKTINIKSEKNVSIPLNKTHCCSTTYLNKVIAYFYRIIYKLTYLCEMVRKYVVVRNF